MRSTQLTLTTPHQQASDARPPTNGESRPGLSGLATYTRQDIKSRIAKGDVLVLHRRLIYKLNAWLKKHPGGELAILHFVGRDATDEIEAYHDDAVLNRMKCFVIGTVSEEDWDESEGGEGWRPLVPPVQIGRWPVPVSVVESSPSTTGDDDSGYATASEESSNESQGSGDELEFGKASSWLEVPISDQYCVSRRSTPRKCRRKANAHSESHASESDSEILRALEPESIQFHDDECAQKYDLSAARQQQLSRSYRILHQQIRSAGLYQARAPFYGYGPDLLRYTVLFTIFFITSPFYGPFKSGVRHLLGLSQGASTTVPSTLQHLFSSVFLGLWWHQITFVAHDAGHSGITGDWTTDRLIGILIGDFLGGISVGWWCDNHDVHHLVTNHPEHDPDIQHLPFFAISNRFFSSLRSTYYKHTMKFDGLAAKLVPHQHRLYYFIMMFARFNLFANSYVFLADSRKYNKYRRLEIIGVMFFWSYFGTLIYLLPTNWIRIMYLLVSFAVTSPLHVQIVLSHFAQSTADLGLTESFAHRQIRTTMDVSCPSYLDFLHGGLHRQVTHHLFPRLPRHHLNQASELFVKPWCQKEGLVYESFKFGEGNWRVLKVLKDVADQVRIVGMVANAQARGEVH